MQGETRVIEGAFGRAAILWLGNDLVPHAHNEPHIIIPLSGTPRQTFFVDSELYALDDDTGYFINPLEVHSFHAPERDAQPSFLLYYIDPAWLARRHDLSIVRPFHRRKIRLDPELRARAHSFVDAILTGYALEDMLVVELELYLNRLLDEALAQQDESDETLPLPRSDFRIRKAMQFMQRNLDTRCSLDSVARHAGLSRPHFFALFVQQTGMTPRIYWNVLRIEKALNEMKQDDVQLGALAYDLGFSSQGNFSRFFRERIGVSPNSYRRAVH